MALFLLQRAKTDKIDAALIAACTAAVQTIHAPPDPRLAPLAEHLTVIEQLVEDAARLKTRRASPRSDSRIGDFWAAEIARTQALVRQELAALLAAIPTSPGGSR